MSASGKLRAPRGTFDLLGADARRQSEVVEEARELLERSGYSRIETPAFEDTELFARGVGVATDIVQKEMFTFEDQGGRSISLRPENTAGVCRAYVEHGMHKQPQPVKLWYAGSFFRYEAPQAGRFRQFRQVGAEALGSDDPTLDAEAILLLAELLERAGCTGLRLRLSSLGSGEVRREYSDELRRHLEARAEQLSDEVRDRLAANPLRAFDSDHAGTRAALEDAPRLIDRLDPDDTAHFAEVRALLDEAGLAYELDGTLVRGLDYYTRTVFEFTSDRLGAQSGVAGGGRYDGLVELIGGAPTPGIGWAAGIERIVLASDAPGDAPSPTVFVAIDADGDRRAAFALARELHKTGVHALLEQAGRSLKGQLRHADRARARLAAIVGADGRVTLRDMATGEQEPVDADVAVARAAALEP